MNRRILSLAKATFFLFCASLCFVLQGQTTVRQCSVAFQLQDSYGDGWNGCAIQIIDGDSTIGTLTVSSGLSYNHDINVTSDTIYLVWIRGSYADECGFTILSEDG